VEVDHDEIRHVEGADIKKKSSTAFRNKTLGNIKLPAKN